MVNLNYKTEIEIFENDGLCTRHEVGEKYNYPEDNGKVCQWLFDSMNSMIGVLKYSGTFLGRIVILLIKKKLIQTD